MCCVRHACSDGNAVWFDDRKSVKILESRCDVEENNTSVTTFETNATATAAMMYKSSYFCGILKSLSLADCEVNQVKSLSSTAETAFH